MPDVSLLVRKFGRFGYSRRADGEKKVKPPKACALPSFRRFWTVVAAYRDLMLAALFHWNIRIRFARQPEALDQPEDRRDHDQRQQGRRDHPTDHRHCDALHDFG